MDFRIRGILHTRIFTSYDSAIYDKVQAYYDGGVRERKKSFRSLTQLGARIHLRISLFVSIQIEYTLVNPLYIEYAIAQSRLVSPKLLH